MLGNVLEWVADRYQEDYYQTLPSTAIDPKGPLEGAMRVLRGGSWVDDSGDVRASFRSRDVPSPVHLHRLPVCPGSFLLALFHFFPFGVWGEAPAGDFLCKQNPRQNSPCGG